MRSFKPTNSMVYPSLTKAVGKLHFPTASFLPLKKYCNQSIMHRLRTNMGRSELMQNLDESEVATKDDKSGGQRGSRNREHMAEIGRRGGETRKKQLGKRGFALMGKKGGEITSRDKAHMAEIGRKGAEARQRNKME